jgi:hypothetical protein
MPGAEPGSEDVGDGSGEEDDVVEGEFEDV